MSDNVLAMPPLERSGAAKPDVKLRSAKEWLASVERASLRLGLAIPKSISLTIPSWVTSTLLGVMSRCTIKF